MNLIKTVHDSINKCMFRFGILRFRINEVQIIEALLYLHPVCSGYLHLCDSIDRDSPCIHG